MGKRKRIKTFSILLIANKSGTVCWDGDATSDESSKGMIDAGVCACDFFFFWFVFKS